MIFMCLSYEQGACSYIGCKIELCDLFCYGSILYRFSFSPESGPRILINS